LNIHVPFHDSRRKRCKRLLSAYFMLNIEILDCFSHYTLVIQKTIVVLHLFFI
jgi:hypothetical protein